MDFSRPQSKPTMTLRRHSTAPSPSSAGVLAPVLVGRKIISSAPTSHHRTRSLKSNPYVGWFRHAPPTTSRRVVERRSDTWRKNVRPWRTYTVPSSLPACKNSPHIGWFRHAPPSRLDNLVPTTATTCTALFKAADFVSSSDQQQQEALLEFFQTLNPALTATEKSQLGQEIRSYSQALLLSHSQKQVMVSGHLRGGGKEYLDGRRKQHLVKDLKESSAEGTLSTVNALSRLASWFLFPVAHDAESCGYRHADAMMHKFPSTTDKKKTKRKDPKKTTEQPGIFNNLSPYLPSFLEEPPLSIPHEEYSKYGARILADCGDEAENNNAAVSRDEDEDGDDDSDSDCDSLASSMASPPIPSSSLNHLSSSLANKDLCQSMTSISSLAEAYYAHKTAIKDGGSTIMADSISSHVPAASALDVGPASPHRLDYVITQMDIARMTRNAARHLDVQSILSLPVITYRKNNNRSGSSSAAGVDAHQPSPIKSLSQHSRMVDKQLPGMSWTIVEESEGRKEWEADHWKKQEVDFCVICLEHFVDGDRLRVLPCDHSFHVGCIDQWLSGSQSFEECYTSGCPTCKKRPTVGKTRRSQSLGEEPSTCNENLRGDKHRSESLDGSVPSWAFAKIGSVLHAQQEGSLMCDSDSGCS